MAVSNRLAKYLADSIKEDLELKMVFLARISHQGP